MATTVEKVKAALARKNLLAHIEAGNARGEVVVNSVSCWSVREAFAAVFASREEGR